MQNRIDIKGRLIGAGCPVFVIAEMSANHNGDFNTAVQIVEAAADAGADAVKLQTYTADTMTIKSSRECFRVSGGTLWDGRTLYDLYESAFTPWEWQPKLKKIAEDLGILLFSTAFDASAVDFLEAMEVPVHKVASFELVDLPLIEKMASTGKPLILSTGMASLEEIEEAVNTARSAGAKQIGLLKCTSAYPAPATEMNLRTIPHLAQTFGAVVGLSDHSHGIAVAVASVVLGACIIEKHFTLSRSVPGPDSAFSCEPAEFKEMVQAIRTVEQAAGSIRYGAGEREEASLAFRRSLFAVEPIGAGEAFTERNVRSIRPAHGLPPKFFHTILGKAAARNIESGTPLSWDLVAKRPDSR